ncbi:MAG TPA: beta-N-acetylhexosaminidase [Gemmatimonadales bacterium]|nr:beta-N-acetylhexosaminidase [Gemmatimonadales bacterium]
MIKILPFAALIAAATPLAAQDAPTVMPWPTQLQLGSGRLRLDSSFTVTPGAVDERMLRGVDRMRKRLELIVGGQLLQLGNLAENGTLTLAIAGPGEAIQTPAEDESYSLDVTASGARLTANTTVGGLRGLETFLQLITRDSLGVYLPVVSIKDTPRFRWRGVNLDVARHWIPVDAVKRTLDGMAVVKLNVLHWHLSEDQGFRVESLKFPKLHQLGSDGRYYTQAEIREIVAYARDRGIRVVPEFDMPGHTTAWFVAYPEYASEPGPYQIERRFGVFDPSFDPSREEVYQFIDDFIGEMTTLFPDPYFHIGGDEVTGKPWDRNPRIVQFKKEKGFKDNHALQLYFNQRLLPILANHHRRMIGWDEILQPGLPTTAIIQSWRGTEYMIRAARQGNASILSAPYYFDHMKTSEEMYLVDPLPPGHGLTPEQEALVLGGEACMWAEHVSMQVLDSRLWPRLGALAERLWSPAAVRNVDDMYRRLAATSIQLEIAGLQHNNHIAATLRRLTGRTSNPVLERLLAITMPASFGQRSGIQRPIQFTPHTKLVDATGPDPLDRNRLVRLAREVVARPTRPTAARAQLEREFQSWRVLDGQVKALADTVPLAKDGIPAARGLRRLGDIGMHALVLLHSGKPAADWKDQALKQVDSLSQPQGLLRIAGADAVRTLLNGIR